MSQTLTFPQLEQHLQSAIDQLFGIGAFAQAKQSPKPSERISEMLSATADARGQICRVLADQNLQIEVEARVKAAEQKVSTLEGQLADAQMQNQALVARVASLQRDAVQVEQRAVELVATVGHKPVPLDPNQNPQNSSSLLAQYNAIKDPMERGRFYREHEQGINEELKPAATPAS